LCFNNIFHVLTCFHSICNIEHVCIIIWNWSWSFLSIVSGLKFKFAFMHFSQYFNRLFFCFNGLIIPEQNLFSKINLLTLFLIDWKCTVQYCLHPNLVIYFFYFDSIKDGFKNIIKIKEILTVLPGNGAKFDIAVVRRSNYHYFSNFSIASL